MHPSGACVTHYYTQDSDRQLITAWWCSPAPSVLVEMGAQKQESFTHCVWHSAQEVRCVRNLRVVRHQDASPTPSLGQISRTALFLLRNKNQSVCYFAHYKPPVHPESFSSHINTTTLFQQNTLRVMTLLLQRWRGCSTRACCCEEGVKPLMTSSLPST